jgi:hypothetical protein
LRKQTRLYKASSIIYIFRGAFMSFFILCVHEIFM